MEGQDHTLAPATTGAVPEGIVHTRAIPPEYRAYVNPNQVVYSALLGSDVGDFAFNWQGLYCSEHSTLIAVATFPALQKRAYNPGTNAPGNNLTRNFMLEFSGAQKITQITLEASVWQLDFTHRLKGMDERERLSNRDIYGRVAFLGDGWLLRKTGSTYAFQPGSGYVEGIRAGLDNALPAVPDTVPCEVFLDVCMEMQGSDRVALAMPVFAPAGAAPQDYSEQPPNSTRHYRERIARIAANGTVTDLRGKLPSVFPEGGTAGDAIKLGADGKATWGDTKHAESHKTGGTDAITPANIGAVATSDARLTDSRTPTKHATSHKTGGTDALTPADIGAYASANMVVAATANKGILRDAAGRAQIVSPAAANDIANKAYCDALPGTRVWVSGEYTPVAGAVTTVTHGLTGLNLKTALADVQLICKVAQAGYAVGDYAQWFSFLDGTYGVRSAARPFITPTVIGIWTGPSGIHFHSGGATLANWRYILRIFY